ncbi:MAG TPA: hypothetical protein VHB79_37510 [Polyangiaceae bacterium]|nr:hypothetical protein [Polyangiaceae bacterium]
MLEQARSEELPLAPDATHRAQLKRSLLQGVALGQAPISVAAASVGAKGAVQVVPFVKGICVGLLLSGGVAVGAHQLSSSGAPSAPVVVAAPSTNAPAPQQPAPTPLSTITPPSSTPTEAPVSEQALPSAKAANAASRPAPSEEIPEAPALALRAELELMTAAQTALRDGRAAESLAFLERYDRTFPGGQLLGERLAAEVFAACQLGDRARATRAATRFLQRDSGSLLAERVRRSCAFQSAGSN